MPIVFRWSVWGDKRRLCTMLPFSLGTFQRVFGGHARYIVGTDEPADVKAIVPEGVEVIPIGDPGETLFNVEGAATWKKWCPSPRIAPDSPEFWVDADVFLVGEPTELKGFCRQTSRRYLVMQEAPGSQYYVGQFGPRILRGIPPINIGLFGQCAGADITNELASELHWWLTHIPVEARAYHDDQGAIVAVLARYFLLRQVELLPQDRYCIVNHKSNADLKTLDGIAAIHATMGYSAFKWFHAEIAAFIAGTSQQIEERGSALVETENL